MAVCKFLGFQRSSKAARYLQNSHHLSRYNWIIESALRLYKNEKEHDWDLLTNALA